MDELRLCIRALVGVIQQASQGNSPMAESQVAHVRKVVRLLSLSSEQIEELPSAERAQVVSIRTSAVHKMKVCGAHVLENYSQLAYK